MKLTIGDGEGIVVSKKMNGVRNMLPSEEKEGSDVKLEATAHPEKSGEIGSAASEGVVARPVEVTSKGNIDGIDGRKVLGWALVKEGGEIRPATVELMLDGRVIAVVAADLLRKDLEQQGMGNGAHGFVYEIPETECDGKVHEISGRICETGARLASKYSTIKLDRAGVLNRLEIQGTAIVGAGHVVDGDMDVSTIAVFEDGKQLVETHEVARNGARFEFRIPLPVDVCDGRVHSFALRSGEGRTVRLGEIAEFTPYVLTPPDALQAYAGGVRPSFWQTANRRYDTLVESLRKLQTSEPAEIENLVNANDAVIRGFQQPKSRGKVEFKPLHFPVHSEPDVSLVIPVHNKFAVTYHCLASLIIAPNRASFEVIVVDDGSSDETLEIGDIVSGITVVRNEVGQGFVRASNKGGEAARGKYVVMLNNDTEVAANWLDELIWPFEHFKDVGMTGAKMVYPNGRLQEAAGIVWGNGDPWNYGRNGNPKDPRFNYARQVDYISGACVMLSKTLWDKIGGFDEFYVPAYFEDTDLAFKVRQLGFKTVYTPFAEVVHFEGLSSGTSTQSGTKRYQEINRPKFKSRWASAYRGNGVVGKDVDLAKDRNVAFRALVIDYATPRPDQDAGAFAAVQEMRLLQSLGFKLTFVPENMAYMGQYTEALQRMGIECQYAPFFGSVHEIIEKRGAEFDMIYITRYNVAQKYIEAIRAKAPNARIVFNNADLHFLRELRQAILQRNNDMLHNALATRDAELAVMRHVDLVLSYNEVEHAVIMSHNLDSTTVTKCPWVVDLPPKVAGFDERKDVAFLGNFGHPPNFEAVEYFVSEIMPKLRKTLPGVRFVVYGSNATKELEALACEDVIIAGWVETVAEVYDACRVFVAPLLTGAGIKGKVLGAMAHGVPSVISSVAAEGVGAGDGRELAIAASPDEWVAAIAKYYQDRAAWEEMSAASRAFIGKRYSFEIGREMMKEALALTQIYTSDDHHTLYS